MKQLVVCFLIYCVLIIYQLNELIKISFQRKRQREEISANNFTFNKINSVKQICSLADSHGEVSSLCRLVHWDQPLFASLFKQKNILAFKDNKAGPILILIRLPLIAIFAFLLTLYHGIIVHAILVTSVRRLTTRIINLIFIRIILFLMGFYSIQTSFKNFSKDASSKAATPKLSSSFIVLSNHTSFVDYLYAIYLISPTFTKMYMQDSAVLLSPLGFFSSLKTAFSLNSMIPIQGNQTELSKLPGSKQKIQSLVESEFQQKKQPIFIFFEGAKTNGSGFLVPEESLLQDIADVQEKYKREVIILNIRYTNKSYTSPINTTRNPVWHLLLLLTNFSNELKASAKSITYPQSAETFDIKAYKDSINSFYESTGIKKMQVTWRDYKCFLDYWWQTKSQKYIEEVKKRE